MVLESILHLAPERLIGVEETNLYTPLWVMGLELLPSRVVTESSTAKHNFTKLCSGGQPWRRYFCVPFLTTGSKSSGFFVMSDEPQFC